MASEIACGPRWPLFNLHGVNILSNSQDSYGIQGNYEEQSDDDERSKDGEQPPDEEQGKDPVLLVFLMLKNQACAHWGKQARYEGHGDDEKQSEDPLVLVFVKFMGQLCRNILLRLKHPQKLTFHRAITAEMFLSSSILWRHRSSPFPYKVEN
jgi:hypothetical protein